MLSFKDVVYIAVCKGVRNTLQMLRFQGCDLHIHYRGISSKDVTCIHEQMGRRRRKEQNKKVTDGSEMMEKKKSQVFLNNDSLVKILWNLQELAQRMNCPSKALIWAGKRTFLEDLREV